ncbi:MAG: MMPL family transporter [Verrucomicrobia bacterium]|nr:MMPL family transporter [Verrucomicrobiota bacterium]
MTRFSRHWLWLLLLIPIGLGLTRLRFDVEVLNLLPKNSPVVRGLMLYQQNFSNGQELLLTIKSEDPDQTEEAARTIAMELRAATNLASQVNWQPPWVESPGQGAELVAYLWLNQPPEVFGQLTNRLSGDELTNTILEAREQITTSLSPETIALRGYDPLDLMRLPENVSAGAQSFGGGSEFFASQDGTFRIVFVQPAYELSGYREADAWLKLVQEIVTKAVNALDSPEEITLSYTGHPAFVTEIASGMQSDMTVSVLGTMVIIAILFWIAHRRFRPLLWLLVLLGLVLGGTLSFGGLFFGTLNVVSLGFAAILLGLSVDYGLILYQEARASKEPIPKVRRTVAPSILWSAVTTAGAFAILNFSGLPGLGQLGSLVAIGVLLSATVMLFAYLPPLRATLSSDGNRGAIPQPAGDDNEKTSSRKRGIEFLIATLALLIISVGILFYGGPTFDQSPEALRPKNSPAYGTLEKIKAELGQTQEPLWIVVSGKSESEVASRLLQAETFLQTAAENKLITSYTLATPLWPRANHQIQNRESAQQIIQNKTNLYAAVLGQGFTRESLHLTENILNTWQSALRSTNIFWPTNDASRWTMNQISSHRNNTFFALGLVYPVTDGPGSEFANSQRLLEQWPDELIRNDVILSGWTVLGAAMFDLVEHDLPRVILPMFVLLVVALWLAFRSFKAVFLSFAALFFAGLCLFALMSLTDQSWNLMNMMAIPLLLGSAVDYSIHIQHAMHRHRGDILAVRRSVGRALLLCGGTTIAGFGSLAFSSNAGMASLGLICAIGIAMNVITAVYFLPRWWRAIH